MADPPWLAPCLDNLRKIPGAVLCPQERCAQFSSYLHAICYCQPPYQNGCPDPPTAHCCVYGPGSPIAVYNGQDICYCCCGAGPGGGMAVDVGGGDARAFDEIAIGDTVYAALDPELREWALLPARFSSGTGAAADSNGVEIEFGDDDSPETLVASPDQLFLVQGGRLKRASRLAAGTDSLTRSDRSAAPVRGTRPARLTGPQHRIATSEGPAADWAGHLIVVNGVVCGDYALQLADLEAANPAMMAETE
jgi:hypothetical protein